MDEPVRGRVSPDDEQMLKHLSWWRRRQWRKRRPLLAPGGAVTTTMTGRARVSAKVLKCRCGNPAVRHPTAPCPEGVWEDHGTLVDKTVEITRGLWAALTAQRKA